MGPFPLRYEIRIGVACLTLIPSLRNIRYLGHLHCYNMWKIIWHGVLGEPKYGPRSEPQWKAGRTRYPDFYKALLEEPSRTKQREMLVADQRSTRTQ